MSLLDQVKKDIQMITSDKAGFAVEMTLTAPSGEVATVSGLHSKHHLGINTDGNQVRQKNAHISIHENDLKDLAYPMLDEDGEIDLEDHLVTIGDITYIIRENFPNNTTGLLVCTLGAYEI